MSRCLLIVDVQNDFCPGGTLAVPEGDRVVPLLNKMIQHAEKHGWIILASRDWHPEKTNHFNTHGGPWPVHCVQGTAGAEFHKDVKLPSTALVFSKGARENENAYSAFDGFSQDGTGLKDCLDGQNIKEIYAGGLATDYCVKATVLDALRLGYKTTLIYDASRAVNVHPGDEEKALDEMKQNGAVILTTQEIVNNLKDI